MDRDTTRFMIRIAKNCICRYVCKMWKKMFDEEYGIPIMYIQDFVHNINAFNWVRKQHRNILSLIKTLFQYGTDEIFRTISLIVGYKLCKVTRRRNIVMLEIWNEKYPYDENAYIVIIEQMSGYIFRWGAIAITAYDKIRLPENIYRIDESALLRLFTTLEAYLPK